MKIPIDQLGGIIITLIVGIYFLHHLLTYDKDLKDDRYGGYFTFKKGVIHDLTKK